MLKDDRLAEIATRVNVARFASFAPDGTPRHLVLGGAVPPGVERLPGALAALSSAIGPAGRLNVRTFLDRDSKGTPFLYGLASVDDAAAAVRDFGDQGYYTIVNEMIDVKDGGVSGVLLGGVIEFAPGATPRAVEDADAAALPTPLGIELLRTVYGLLDLTADLPGRVEFSVHPVRVGARRRTTVLWEQVDVQPPPLRVTPSWPNGFSRHIGDKAYGLLVAHLLGLPVPVTTVIGRKVAPFTFGTGDRAPAVERWIRTCPTEPQPGLFTSHRGWLDPFLLLAKEDPTGDRIAAVLDQRAVDARFSGATATAEDGSVLLEGVRGAGDAFMQGSRPAETLPADVVADVAALVRRAAAELGSVRIEWAHDGGRAWVIQLHTSRARVTTEFLNPGSADRWLPYDPVEGLDRLRDVVAEARRSGAGVVVTGPVGITSHVGDIIRKEGVPGRLAAGADRRPGSTDGRSA
ncbi:MAG: hypothetical protein ACJ73E_06500 [Mycobacteriales bacterium]